jgi:Flp pilus assembly protein TadG
VARPFPGKVVAALWKAQTAVAAVEFALISPLLVTLFVGVVNYGLIMQQQLEVGNAARAGAAYASAYGYDQVKVITAAQSATSLSNLTVTATQTTNACADFTSAALIDAGSAKLCPATAIPPGTFVTVNTKLTYTLLVPPPTNGSLTLTSSAIAQIK